MDQGNISVVSETIVKLMPLNAFLVKLKITRI